LDQYIFFSANRLNIPFQFTGTGQKLEAFDTLVVYSFPEITSPVRFQRSVLSFS